jgi:hypothetical protein
VTLCNNFIVGLFQAVDVLIEQDGGGTPGCNSANQCAANAVGSTRNQNCPVF